MVDAGLKLEVEDTDEVAESTGAVIGGIGVDKYEIVQVATKYKAPVCLLLLLRNHLKGCWR
jgi:hypothetical protein